MTQEACAGLKIEDATTRDFSFTAEVDQGALEQRFTSRGLDAAMQRTSLTLVDDLPVEQNAPVELQTLGNVSHNSSECTIRLNVGGIEATRAAIRSVLLEENGYVDEDRLDAACSRSASAVIEHEIVHIKDLEEMGQAAVAAEQLRHEKRHGRKGRVVYGLAHAALTAASLLFVATNPAMRELIAESPKVVGGGILLFILSGLMVAVRGHEDLKKRAPKSFGCYKDSPFEQRASDAEALYDRQLLSPDSRYPFIITRKPVASRATQYTGEEREHRLTLARADNRVISF